MIRRPPGSALFPSTTLFRSAHDVEHHQVEALVPLAVRQFQELPGGGCPVLLTTPSTRPCLSRVPPTRASRSASSVRSEEHTSELQSRQYLVCRLLLEKKTPF